MRAVLLIFTTAIAGCSVNAYSKYYNPVPGSELVLTDPTYIKPSTEPKVYAHSSDIQVDRRHLEEDGYVLVGTSSFYGPANKATKDQAIDQGKKVGAFLIMIQSSYKDTLRGATPLVLANPTQYATINTTGTVNSLNTGNAATYNSTSTVAMPGGYTTYQIPYSVDRNDFFASYWTKRDPSKIRLGVNVAPLPNELRRALQRNTGVIAQVVVKGSPAFIANILEGDVILKLNDEDVIDPQNFIDRLRPLGGQTVDLIVYRSGELRNFKVNLNP